MENDRVKILIATIKSWNIDNAQNFKDKLGDKYDVKIISDKLNLSYQEVVDFNPEYIFFPHWSWKISSSIFENFKCVLFHMTDLPYGRGGSPLQNLVVRGVETTKISAVKVAEELDSGDIYLKKEIDLEGSAQDIFERISKVIFSEMIPFIVGNSVVPLPQEGVVTYFERRTPEQSQIDMNASVNELYNHIRMLDAESYPKAFIRLGEYTLEFTGAEFDEDELCAKVKFLKE